MLGAPNSFLDIIIKVSRIKVSLNISHSNRQPCMVYLNQQFVIFVFYVTFHWFCFGGEWERHKSINIFGVSHFGLRLQKLVYISRSCSVVQESHLCHCRHYLHVLVGTRSDIYRSDPQKMHRMKEVFYKPPPVHTPQEQIRGLVSFATLTNLKVAEKNKTPTCPIFFSRWETLCS